MRGATVQFGGANHRLRGWLVFLLEELARQGLSPVSQQRMHLLMFFAAVLTPVRGLEQPVPKILRHRDKPFYPEGQDELIRLAMRGLVETPTRSSIRDDGWDTGTYAITEDGVRVADELRKTAWGAETASFVRDLVGSFSELDPKDADEIIGQDEIFGENALRRGEIQNIKEDNPALAAAREVADYEVEGLRPSPRDSIALYFEYLSAKRAA